MVPGAPAPRIAYDAGPPRGFRRSRSPLDPTRDIRRILRRDVPTAYNPLIARMRFHVEPEISCSRFLAEACYTAESLAAVRAGGPRSGLEFTEMGAFLAERMTGAIFIDVPCGLHSARDAARDWDLVPLMRPMGIAEYWEVDLTAAVVEGRVESTSDVTAGGTGYALGYGLGAIGLRDESGLSVATMQDDLLGFVSKLPSPGNRPPLTLYISALQPDAALCASEGGQRRVAVPYLTALYRELERVCGREDMLILNSPAMLATGIDADAYPETQPAVALLMRDFAVLRRCAYGKVHVYSRG